MKKLITLLTAFLVLGGGMAVAQNKTSLNIQCNEGGADVYINGRLAGKTTPNFSFLVPQGNIQVRVQKNGFRTFETIVKAGSRPVNLLVQLQRMGAAPAPMPAPPRKYPLSLGKLRPGSEVFLNGVRIGAAGAGPFSVDVEPGTYTLTIRTGGFREYSVQITVGNAPQTVSPIFRPMPASYSVDIPSSMMNPDARGNPWSQLRLYIDGAPQRDFQGEIEAGRHTIRLSSGAFQVEATFDFEAGRTYTFQPFLGLNIR